MKKVLLTILASLIVVTSINAQSKKTKENIRYDKDSVTVSWYALYTTDGEIIECLNVNCKNGANSPVIYNPLNEPNKSITLPREKAWKSYYIFNTGTIGIYTIYNIDYEAEDQKRCKPIKNSWGHEIYIDSISGKRRPDIESCQGITNSIVIY